MPRVLLAAACAVGGAIVGYFGFLWMFDRGFYALVLPGGLAGLAAGIPRTRGISAAVIAALVASVAGLVAEHAVAPFIADRSLAFFFAHVGELRPVTLALIGLGAVIGFYVPFRRREAGSQHTNNT